jgi:tRNA1Val (adenine37-N6)-methyltransferase
MSNTYFKFKQFIIHQDRCAMKVTTDACLFGAWVAKKISDLMPAHGNILDIGAGTCLLSLMISQQCDGLIDAVEIDEDAAAQAKNNIALSPWKENIRIIQGDIKELAKNSLSKYDIVISNPPFYENELVSPGTKKNIAHHSKELLLNEVLQAILQTLRPGGHFFLLLPFKRMAEAELLFKRFNFSITDTVLVRESAQHNFFRVFVSGNLNDNANENKYSKNELVIRDEQQSYTREFTGLLKEYYLHL